MSAQKQASASPYAFSEWANGLRQRQLEDIDDAVSASPFRDNILMLPKPSHFCFVKLSVCVWWMYS